MRSSTSVSPRSGQNGAASLKFWQVLGFTEKKENNQSNTLIYAMSDEVDNILTSVKLTEAYKKYDFVKQKLKGTSSRDATYV